MDTAKASGDVEAYFEARTIVEVLKKDGFDAREFAEVLASGETASPSTPTTPEPAPLIINNEFLNLEAVTDIKDSKPGETPEYLIDRENDILYVHVKADHPEALHTPDHLRLHTKFELQERKPNPNGPGFLPDEAEHLVQLLGYKYKVAVRGESLYSYEQDTPHSVSIYADFTKSRRDDLGDAFHDLQTDLADIFVEGSPIRTTKDNTRLVEGLHRDLEPELYYGYSGVSNIAAQTYAPAGTPPGVIKL